MITGLTARDIRFVVARARTVVVEQIDRFELTDVLGPDNRFPTVRSAVLAVAGVDVTGGTQWTGPPPPTVRRGCDLCHRDDSVPAASPVGAEVHHTGSTHTRRTT